MVWKRKESEGPENALSTTLSRCDEVIERIKAAIEDEEKAGPDYRDLAGDTQEMFCGRSCPQGFLAMINIQSIAEDENKHKALLEQLLSVVERRCDPERIKEGTAL